MLLYGFEPSKPGRSLPELYRVPIYKLFSSISCGIFVLGHDVNPRLYMPVFANQVSVKPPHR